MIQIVGKMHDGKPVIFDNPVDKPVEVDDVLLNEDGEYLRAILDRQRLSSVVLPDVQPIIISHDVTPMDSGGYQKTIDYFLMGTGRI